jgi:hypothetical protein
MPKRAIILTFQNFKPNISAFISKVQQNYEFPFVVLFDRKTELDFKIAMSAVVSTDSLKVFICGHGGTGHGFVTDDTGRFKRSSEDLTQLLKEKTCLGDRCKDPKDIRNTKIVMIACNFGRAPEGRLNDSAAVKLHRMLRDARIYVNLEARTESMAGSTADGTRITIDPSMSSFWDAKKDYLTPSTAYDRKADFTKVMCTFSAEGAAVAHTRDYTNNRWIYSGTLKQHQILWADKVVDAVQAIIKRDENGSVKDVKQQMLEDKVLVHGYLQRKQKKSVRDPEKLRKNLEDLLTDQTFMSHQGWGAAPAYFTGSLPATAQLIEKLLSEYPNSPYAAPGSRQNHFNPID